MSQFSCFPSWSLSSKKYIFFLHSFKNGPESESESYVTTDGQPASLSWSKTPIWGLRPDLYYMYDSYGLVLVRRPLWREVGSVFCMCCWPLPVQSFSGPSPLGLETIFYCLTFATSLFVASYDSQGHGGGIRPRLHTGIYEEWPFIAREVLYPISKECNHHTMGNLPVCYQGNEVQCVVNKTFSMYEVSTLYIPLYELFLGGKCVLKS
jgi:hypothetical protein